MDQNPLNSTLVWLNHVFLLLKSEFNPHLLHVKSPVLGPFSSARRLEKQPQQLLTLDAECQKLRLEMAQGLRSTEVLWGDEPLIFNAGL